MDITPGPRISIVTPSFNQAQFLEGTIRSVLSQGYPNLEYIVIDGGSSDDTVTLIRRYEKQLAYWVSERDGGQYDAINKGFSRSSGEIMAWINSDDMYLPWAFEIVAEIFVSRPEIQWLTSIAHLYWDEGGRGVHCSVREGFNRQEFYRGRNGGVLGYERSYVMQESTFWRRELWDAAGGFVDSTLDLAGDFELWARFWQYADLYATPAPLSGFRIHHAQKTASRLGQYREEAREVLDSYGSRLPGRAEGQILRAARLLPFLKPLCGRKALTVRFDHQLAQWVTGTMRFL